MNYNYDFISDFDISWASVAPVLIPMTLLSIGAITYLVWVNSNVMERVEDFFRLMW